VALSERGALFLREGKQTRHAGRDWGEGTQAIMMLLDSGTKMTIPDDRGWPLLVHARQQELPDVCDTMIGPLRRQGHGDPGSLLRSVYGYSPVFTSSVGMDMTMSGISCHSPVSARR
jgi:hypothetical protein